MLAGFNVDEADKLLLETDIWNTAQEQLGPQALLDEGMPKLRGELLVGGSACAANEKEVTAAAVEMSLGPIRKRLDVVGDRYWVGNESSAPAPFATMPLDWAHAFGGDGYEANPLGKGAVAIETDEGAIQPLPNVEDPRHVVAAPSDRPAPASLGACPAFFSERSRHLGTYDHHWLKTRFPGFAADFDARYLQLAPKDQWLEEGTYFKGTESFAAHGMHPERPHIEGRLPAIRARAFVTHQGEPADALHEATTRLETVWLFPGQLAGMLVFRGLVETVEDDAADITALMCGFERIGEDKPRQHYQQALARRLDPEKGHLFSLRDKELLPQGFASALDGMVDLTGDKEEDLLRQHMDNRAQAALDQARHELRDHGIDPDEHGLPAELPESEAPLGMDMPKSVDELPDFLDQLDEKTAALEKDAESRRAEAEQKARESCAAQGVDYDQLVADAQEKAGGPPEFSAERELERLQDQLQLSQNAGVALPEVEEKLRDPELAESLVAAEKAQIDAYRQFAHFFPATTRLDGDEAQRLRDEVERALSACESLAERDLTGADLSGLDLSGADLSRAFLEAANLSGCKLSGATLQQTVLARADLSRADLSGTRLSGANLGQAKLVGATLRKADLSGAVLYQADLTDARLSEARLKDAELLELRLGNTDLTGAEAPGTHWIHVDFADVDFAKADLEASVFVECKLQRCSFAEANVSRCVFVECQAEETRFERAKAKSLCVLKDSVFDGAVFAEAELEQACLRGASLRGADFSKANLDKADFSGADCTGGRFERCVARESSFMKTRLGRADLTDANLMLAMLQKAELGGTEFLGANLVRANLLGAVGDKRTSFHDALVLETVHQGLL